MRKTQDFERAVADSVARPELDPGETLVALARLAAVVMRVARAEVGDATETERAQLGARVVTVPPYRLPEFIAEVEALARLEVALPGAPDCPVPSRRRAAARRPGGPAARPAGR